MISSGGRDMAIRAVRQAGSVAAALWAGISAATVRAFAPGPIRLGFMASFCGAASLLLT